MKERTDVELITRIQAGDDHAFEELYHRYERKCYYTAFSIMRNEHDAKDAVQATFIQIHKSIHSLRKPEFFVLWLNRITCGKCKDIFRRNKTVSIDINEDRVINGYEEERIDFNPKDTARFQNDKELLDLFISELPYAQREVIVLCYFQNLTMQEMAEVLDEPIGTIKSRLFLAKKNLRRRIEGYESREKIGLNFHSLSIDALLTSYFASCFVNVAVGSASSITLLSKVKNLFMTSTGKVVLSGALLSTTGVVATQVYQSYQETQNNTLQQSSIQQSPSTIDNSEIKDARHAYFTLLNWAANQEQIKRRSSDEVRAIKTVYEYLKKDGGPYWIYLEEKGWTSFFEQKLKF